jgi:neprilysin
MDRSIDPCSDFYKFTCGNWQEDHPRPDSSSSHDWFAEKQTKILRKVREFLQKNSTGAEPLPVQQTRLMYKACMNLGKLMA